jgi:hypothetical protein
MSRGILKIKPECLKPGLNVMVDWYGDQRQMLRGEVQRKLRKNWLVTIQFGTMDKRKCSVPYDRMTIDLGYTKEGRPLLATKEDKKIFWSKEHIEYHKSLVVDPEDKPEVKISQSTVIGPMAKPLSLRNTLEGFINEDKEINIT